MGRETRILLGLLGLLAGLFVGVLSLKLLVPRPPEGAGPDVHGDMAFTVRQELVPPPARGPRAADFAAAPPLVATVPTALAVPALGLDTALPPDPAGSRTDDPPPSRFALAPPAADLDSLDAGQATTDPFVQRAAFAEEEPAGHEPAAGGSRFASPAFDAAGLETATSQVPAVDATLDEGSAALPAGRFGSRVGTGVDEPLPDRMAPPPGADPFAADRTAVPLGAAAPVPQPLTAPHQADPFVRPAVPAPPAPLARQPLAAGPIAGGHVVAAGDSWWSLAERAYGDGRLYRALYAWNRARDPRVTLVPGTALEVPPVERLTATWPTLVPTGR